MPFIIEQSETKISVKRKRVYYGRPPLTQKEVEERVNKGISSYKKAFEELIDIVLGKRQWKDCSDELREIIREKRLGDSSFFTRSNTPRKKSRGKNLLSRSSS